MPTLINVNGRDHALDIEPETPILWALRDSVGLTGTKFGCGKALCGACTVHLDGKAIRSCVTPVSAAAGRKLVTIEGLAWGAGQEGQGSKGDSVAQVVRDAWIRHDVVQCGYCQSGQIMSAVALLQSRGRGQPLTDEDIDAAMAGNICRCGTYARIRTALVDAAARLG